MRSEYFGKPESGNKRELERHCLEETKLEKIIAELEKGSESDPDSSVVIQAYRNLLNRLRDRKALYADRVGRK